MTGERASLIEIVYEWDRKAIAVRDPERRRQCWKILDALYADSPRRRSSEFLSQVERVLDSMKQDSTTRRIRAELGMVG